MKKICFALGMTALTLTANQCLADTKPAMEISKTAAASSMQKVPLNTATLEQLDAIPGLGEKKAQAVLDYIAEHGPIKDQTQLTQVKGIGEKLAAKISPYLSFN
ncbi:helix-hairpin-helix domain-containing protein [Rheinheimera sp.]|uniref:ComEA family DNA-binding protein n=1 Tax=Rheinheimera sp. TaxID=1869214 RepID=UPI0027341C80|nr:helix-hairpin-helix domain-containing protein [Rheinheimera sp.]MDP2715887.1 helix-hairpin-helix domain-containing protein [Rheinheimera sp.]